MQPENVHVYLSPDNSGACTGDAGGPLMCLHGGSPIAAGILSWAEGCRLNSTPAVFSDIKEQYLNKHEIKKH